MKNKFYLPILAGLIVAGAGVCAQAQSLPQGAGPFVPVSPGEPQGPSFGIPGLPDWTSGGWEPYSGPPWWGMPGQAPTSGSGGSDTASAGATGAVGRTSSDQDHISNWVDHINDPYAFGGAPMGQTQRTINDQVTSGMLDTEVSTELMAPGTVSPEPYNSGDFHLGFPTNVAGPGGGGPWGGDSSPEPRPTLSDIPTTSTSSVDLTITNGYD